MHREWSLSVVVSRLSAVESVGCYSTAGVQGLRPGPGPSPQAIQAPPTAIHPGPDRSTADARPRVRRQLGRGNWVPPGSLPTPSDRALSSDTAQTSPKGGSVRRGQPAPWRVALTSVPEPDLVAAHLNWGWSQTHPNAGSRLLRQGAALQCRRTNSRRGRMLSET